MEMFQLYSRSKERYPKSFPDPGGAQVTAECQGTKSHPCRWAGWRARASPFAGHCPAAASDSPGVQTRGCGLAAAADITLLILFYREQPSLLCRVQNVLFCELSLNFPNPLCLRNHTDTEGRDRGDNPQIVEIFQLALILAQIIGFSVLKMKNPKHQCFLEEENACHVLPLRQDLASAVETNKSVTISLQLLFPPPLLRCSSNNNNKSYFFSCKGKMSRPPTPVPGTSLLVVQASGVL